jgi:uncharacterized protein GlcG (DUF336 family)
VIIMTGHGSVDACRRAFRNGVFEFFTKPLDADKLIESVGLACEESQRRFADWQAISRIKVRFEQLTAREHEVLAVLMEGLSNKEVAARLTCRRARWKRIVQPRLPSWASRAWFRQGASTINCNPYNYQDACVINRITRRCLSRYPRRVFSYSIRGYAMKKLMMAAALVAGSVSLTAQADSVSQKNLSLAQANALANSAVQACLAKNYQVSVTVVDRAGVVKAVQRTDNAGPHTVKASEMKAFTALSAKNASGKVMEAAQNNAGAQNMRDIPGFLLLAGGLPVKEGDEVIGAIGIGGAPGGHLDEACAQAAIDGLKK